MDTKDRWGWLSKHLLDTVDQATIDGLSEREKLDIEFLKDYIESWRFLVTRTPEELDEYLLSDLAE